jgi:hypothetical protein
MNETSNKTIVRMEVLVNRPNGICWFSTGFYLIWASSSLTSVNETDFKNVNEIVLNIYTPIIAEKLNSSVELKEYYYNFGGAFSRDSVRKLIGEPRFVLTLTGNIPNFASMNIAGYALVACHELGHIMGGEPRQRTALDLWSSVEGQADYFATNTCMWRYVKTLPLPELIKDLDDKTIDRCYEKFGSEIDRAHDCLKILAGIDAMAKYFNSNAKNKTNVSINNQDLSSVDRTMQKYPSLQCRVDTWMAGMFDEPRPRCWYKPNL